MLQQKLFYAARDGEIRGPFFLDNLNPLLAKRLIATSELAWHNSIAGWQPLSELVRILEEQQSFRLSGFLLFMNWVTSGRWMARPSRPDLISTPQTISKSPQPFDERIDAFSLSRPYLNTKQDIEEFFKKQDAPPVIIDEYGGTAVRITSYESDMARLKELIESFLEEKALADDKKIQPVKTPQNTKNILILLRLIYHRYI
jgi:hypothetical protein